jgi:uncharacterized protein (DUF362 family)
VRVRQFLTSTAGEGTARVSLPAARRVAVARCRSGTDLEGDLDRLLSLLPEAAIAPLAGARVLLKPSLNSHDPYPATSDPAFARLTERALLRRGASTVELAESTGIANPLGVEATASALGFPVGSIRSLDHGPWRRVAVPSSHLRSLRVATLVMEAEYLVYLVCLKTHSRARFSIGIKAAMGVIHPADRVRIHLSRTEHGVADVNLAARPDLVIVDGRKAMVTGGPEKGRVIEMGWLLASTDLVALDVECLKLLRAVPAENRLDGEPWQLPQVARAVEMGWGCRREEDYEVRGDPA